MLMIYIYQKLEFIYNPMFSRMHIIEKFEYICDNARV